MVALVLLALLVVPLARRDRFGRRAERPRCAPKQQEVASELRVVGCSPRRGSGDRCLGDRGMAARTHSRSRHARCGRHGVLVGLWCDGWSLGEREVDPEGRVRMQASDLRDLVGGELLVRVREAEGTWGPPWRSIVAGQHRGLLIGGCGLASLSDARSRRRKPYLKAVVHAPTLANPRFEVSPKVAKSEAAYPGLTF